MSLQIPSRVDALVGDSIEAAVRLKHRRRLHCIDLTDSSGDRYDSSAHRARRSLGWHDVATRLEGPAVADVHDHFPLRWKELTGETLDRPAPPAPAGEHTVQVVRTVAEDMYERVPRGDFRILESYMRALPSARRFVYLENQFLWAPEIVAVLAQKLRQPPSDDFRVVVVLPALGEGREDPLYVHAKVGIVDDRWLWAEHLELEEPEAAAADPATLVDQRWRPIAMDQLARRRAGAPPTHRLLALPGFRVARAGCSARSRACSTTAEAAEPYDPGVEPVRSNPVQDFPSAAQIRRDRVRDGLQATPLEPPTTRLPPPPLHGGALGFLRFARRRGMLRIGYVPLILRWAWLKLRWRGRLRTDGLCFVCPNVKFEIGKHATVSLGRWSWLGHGTKIRAHEGSVEIGAKTVLGQECTISAYQHVSIGRECIVADRVMLIDFDHGVVDVERPIRDQGIYKRDVNVGHNVWIGYGACVLRGVTIGDNCVVGTSSVVTKDLPENAVAAGAPARVVRKRAAPRTFRWG